MYRMIPVFLALWSGLMMPLPAQAAQLRIGLSLPLSGTVSILGQQFRQGAEFALQELAADAEIEIITADDGCDADLARLAAEDLRAASVNLATGFLCNDAARSAAEVFVDSQVPLVIAGARSEQLMRDANRQKWNLFRIPPGDDRAATAATRILAERWKGRPWAVIDDGTVYGRSLADAVRAGMEESGAPPQFADNFRPAQSTQAGLIRRLQGSGVTAAFVAGSAEDVAIIWDNVGEFSGRIEVVGGESLEALPLAPEAERTPPGLLAVMQPDPADLPGIAALSSRLAGNSIEPEPYVFLGYAAMELALAALRASPQETSQALQGTSFRTILGNVEFGEDRTNQADVYGLFSWNGTRFAPVEAGQQ